MCEYKLKDRFLQKKYLEDASEKSTLEKYSRHIVYLYKYISKKKNIDIADEEKILKSVTKLDIEELRNYMLNEEDVGLEIEGNRHSSVSRINTLTTALRQFSSYLYTLGVIDNNFMDGMKAIKYNKKNDNMKKKKTIDYLTFEEAQELLKVTYSKEYASKGGEFKKARTRCLISLLATTGQRINSILSVTMDMIEKKDDCYIISIPDTITKCKIPVRVPIANKTLEYFNKYIEERNKLKYISKENYLIVTSQGKRHNANNTNKEIKQLCKLAGIEKHFTNHNMRKYFRSQLTFNNVNENLIKLIGGWKNDDAMAEIYVNDDNSDKFNKQKIEVCNII